MLPLPHSSSLQAGFAQVGNETVRLLQIFEMPALQRKIRTEAHDLGGLRMRLLHHAGLDVSGSQEMSGPHQTRVGIDELFENRNCLSRATQIIIRNTDLHQVKIAVSGVA